MNYLKLSYRFWFAMFCVSALVSCEYAEDTGWGDADIDGVKIDANITSNTTWTTGGVYILTKRITVESGATLIIEPGVIVKGQVGTGANATALIIARGAKIMAEGTAVSPIIFTTVSDQIKPGELVSSNLSVGFNGLWGGLIVLGNAPISADADAVQIEGIPPSDQNGLYGGSISDDNSGIIRYVSIRHGGANIGEGNEINGLTLGGVGSLTTIDHIEIVANQDDGVEWFGGTVNVSDVLVWSVGDDAIDTDQAWSGTLDNFVILNPGDECFELDGAEGGFVAEHTIINGTVYVEGADGLVDLDNKGDGDASNSFVNMSNIYFLGLPTDKFPDFDDNPAELTLSDIEVTLPSNTVSIEDYYKEGTHTAVKKVDLNMNNVGSDVSAFDGWTWASIDGQLDKL